MRKIQGIKFLYLRVSHPLCLHHSWFPFQIWEFWEQTRVLWHDCFSPDSTVLDHWKHAVCRLPSLLKLLSYQQSKKVNSTMAKFIKPFLNLLFNKLSEGLPAFDTLLSVHIQLPKPNWHSVRTNPLPQPGTAVLTEL